MPVPEFLQTLENSGLSTWIRESQSVFGFYFILLFHNFGLAMLVGASVIIDLRILGVVPGVPVKSLEPLFKIMWAGLIVGTISGVLLLLAYPTKALTNPVFYVKLALIAFGVIMAFRIKNRVFDNPSVSEADMTGSVSMAKWSIVLWIASITAGRLLAYTYVYLIYGTKGAVLFDIFKII